MFTYKASQMIGILRLKEWSQAIEKTLLDPEYTSLKKTDT